MHRRSFVKSTLILAGLAVGTPSALADSVTSYGAENDAYLREHPWLVQSVRESERSFGREEISIALTALRESASREDAPVDGGQIVPMGVVCVRVRRWQVLAVSYALDVGALLSKVKIDPPGNLRWPSIFEAWKISHYGSGGNLRDWISEQTWPKRVCASEGPA